MTDVEDSHSSTPLTNHVENSVDVWLLAKQQLADVFVLTSDRSTLGKLLQAVDGFRKLIEPGERLLVDVCLDEVIDELQVAQKAIRKVNAVSHGFGGKLRELGGLAEPDPSWRGPVPGGFPHPRRPARRCPVSADRLAHPALLLGPFRLQLGRGGAWFS